MERDKHRRDGPDWSKYRERGGNCGRSHKQRRDVYGSRVYDTADNHYGAGESDGDGRTNCDVRGGGHRDGATELSVAEKRNKYRGSHSGELLDSGNDDGGQRIDISSGSDKFRGFGDEQCGRADRELGFCSRYPGKPHVHQLWKCGDGH